MSDNNKTKPETMNWLSPYIAVEDVKAAVNFYTSAFGFELATSCEANEGLEESHAELKYKGLVIAMLGKVDMFEQGEKTPKQSGLACPINLYVYVDDVNSFFEAAKSNGAEIVKPPADQVWGDRVCCLKDIDGYYWSFGTHQA